MKIFFLKTCVYEYNERIFAASNKENMKAIIIDLIYKLGFEDLDVIELPDNWEVTHQGKTITKSDLVAFCLGQI